MLASEEYLSERLENLWQSVTSLVARKDDQDSVNRKLDGLHRLLTGEFELHFKNFQNDIRNSLSEKVSLGELQEILVDGAA